LNQKQKNTFLLCLHTFSDVFLTVVLCLLLTIVILESFHTVLTCPYFACLGHTLITTTGTDRYFSCHCFINDSLEHTLITIWNVRSYRLKVLFRQIKIMEGFSNVSGTSILVPSVQELAKKNLATVPQRYVQPQREEEMVLISQEPNATLQIPVIDMQRLLSQEYGNSELDKLHLACKEWGFFQVSFISSFFF